MSNRDKQPKRLGPGEADFPKMYGGQSHFQPFDIGKTSKDTEHVGAGVYSGHFSLSYAPSVHPRGFLLESTIVLSDHLLHEPCFGMPAKE